MSLKEKCETDKLLKVFLFQDQNFFDMQDLCTHGYLSIYIPGRHSVKRDVT